MSGSTSARFVVPGPLLIVGLVVAWVFIVGTAGGASASLGDLDPGFGVDGRAETPVDFTGLRVTDVDVDAAGRVLVSGYHYDAAVQHELPVVVRLLGNGALDPTFGSSGMWTTDVRGVAPHIAVLGDGRVAVASATTIVRDERGRSAVRFVVLDEEGILDPSFGVGGVRVVPIGSRGPNWCYEGALGDVTTAPDGDIVAAAIHVTDCRSMFPEQRDAAVIRLRADGSRESSFSSDGVGYYRVSSLADCCYITPIEISVGADGDISWVGSAQRGRDGFEEWQEILTIVRVDRFGRPVTMYGEQGVARLAGWDVAGPATSASVLDTGAVVVAGRGGRGWGQYAGRRLVVRFGPRGRLDPEFSSDGVWVGGHRGDVGQAVGTWIDGVGRIAAAWSLSDYSGERNDLFLCRLGKAGTLDRTFGAEGCVRERLLFTWLSRGPTAAPGRKLVLAGYGGASSEEPASIVAVRLLTV